MDGLDGGSRYPRDADAIADDLPAIGDAITNVLRQTLRIATALPVAA